MDSTVAIGLVVLLLAIMAFKKFEELPWGKNPSAASLQKARARRIRQST